MPAAPSARVRPVSTIRRPKEPVLSRPPRHRTTRTTSFGALFTRARHALRGSHQLGLFVVTALVCTGLLLAVPLALYFAAPGGGSGGGYGGEGAGGVPATLTPTASL